MARVSLKAAQALTLRPSCSFSAPLSALQEASHFSVMELWGVETCKNRYEVESGKGNSTLPPTAARQINQTFLPSFPSTLLLIYQMTSRSSAGQHPADGDVEPLSPCGNRDTGPGVSDDRSVESGSGGNSAGNPRRFRPFSASQETLMDAKQRVRRWKGENGRVRRAEKNILKFPKRLISRSRAPHDSTVCRVR